MFIKKSGIKAVIAFWCSSLSALSSFSADALNEGSPGQVAKKGCGQGLEHMRAAVRYTSPKGIGYNTGYTTLEAFFAPPDFLGDTWLPFVDLRAHVFDNGKFAANAGAGFRYLAQSRIWGANIYYDYRNTEHQHYNQVSAGFESLGTVWDFRLNGYLPVGRKQSPYFHNRFDSFKNHYMLIKRTRDFAMKGINAEAGAHVDYFKKVPLYFAAGPYYLTGVDKTTWGGELRAVVDLFNRHLRLEGNTSYDHFFKWIGQGQASINVFFGGKNKVNRKKSSSCSAAMTLNERAVQRVDRNEIIPLGRQHVIMPAINPATGEPWFFLFVNNTSSSAGTYESPYPALQTAQNASFPEQVIYVFPGDGTTRNMNAGITLQNGQMLLGAGTKHHISTTAGTISIPALASVLPNITNTTGNVVALANNNTVAGFYIISNNGMGITGTGISNFTAIQNIFVTSATDTNGINLLNPSGQVVVEKSIFSGFVNSGSLLFPNDGNGIYVEVDTGSTLTSLDVVGSDFSNITGNFAGNGGNGIFANPMGGTIANMTVVYSTFNNISIGAGILAFPGPGGTITNLSISGCAFGNLSNFAAGVSPNLQGGTITNLNISRCTFNEIGTSANGIFTTLNVAGDMISDFNIWDSSFSNISGSAAGISVDTVLGTIPNMTVAGNIFSGISSTTGFTYVSSTPGNLAVSSNSFSGSSSAPTGYAVFIQPRIASISTCLEFIGNSASPINNPAPYFFNGTSGTLNRTIGSDNSTNVGQIFIMGNVNPPGSCSQ